jgi:pimeloyl-ACP methyl ester carboxylesterase
VGENHPVGPETRYALSGDVHIAYQVVGDGPLDLIFIPGFVTHVELQWRLPGFAAFLNNLGSFSRLIRFDKRGTGMSDPVSDGFLATFDGPARAIRCACALVQGMHDLGLSIRAGLHTGECEVVDGTLAGIAVHTGARVAALAGADEVLVSSTVRDLVAGSGIGFADRGLHELKGIPGDWRLFAVAS